MLHGVESEMTEVRTKVVPHRATAAQLFVDGLKQGATEFLRLVQQKRQHHQHREDHRKILPTVAKVVLEVIPLILQRIECFIFDLPTRSATSDQMTRIARSDRQIGDPAETFANRAIRSVLGVLQEVHTQIRVRFVQRQVVYKTNFTLHIRIVVVRPVDRGDPPLGVGLAHLVE